MENHPSSADAARVLGDRTLVLVGLMGAGKTTVGRRLAKFLRRPFRDADHEIEAAAGRTVSEIFTDFGETAFREGERKVIARLIEEEPPMVLALGGGAFVDEDTRALVKAKAVSVWLQADLDTLVERVGRKDTRPLLQQGDPREILSGLMARREPAYAQADVHVAPRGGSHDHAARAILSAIAEPSCEAAVR